MSDCTCQPVQFCSPPNFGLDFPSLVGPTGATGPVPPWDFSMFFWGAAVLGQTFGYFSPQVPVIIQDIGLVCQTAPTGAALTVDLVNSSGVPLGRTVSIPAGQQYVKTSIVPLLLDANDFIRARFTGIGSGDPGGGVSVNLYFDSSSSAGGSTTIAVENIVALKALNSALPANTLVEVLGYYTKNDGGGGLFYFLPTSITPVNTGTIFAPNSGIGRWFRVLSGDPKVAWYGAKGDGVTDDSAAILAALQGSGPGSVVVFDSGKSYLTTVPITVPYNDQTLKGYGATITSALETQYNKFRFYGKSKGAVLGLHFDCLYSSSPVGLSEGAVDIGDSNDITVRDCYFEGVSQSAIRVFGLSARTVIQDNGFYRYFCAVFFDNDLANQPTQAKITGNKFLAGLVSTSTAYSGAIKVSGSGNIASHVGHVISNNLIDSPGQMGIEIQGGVNDCVISGNEVKNSGYGISVSGCWRAVISGNTVHECASFGIEVASNSFDVAVTGNTIYQMVVNSRAITVVSGSRRVAISGNSVYCSGSGVYVSANDVQITGNTFMYNGVVYCHNASNVSVIGNTFKGETGASFTVLWLDATDNDVEGIMFCSNRVLSGYDNSVLMLYSPNANVIRNVLVSGNSLVGSSCSASTINYAYSASSCIENVRVAGNFSSGTNDFHETLNPPFADVAVSMAWPGGGPGTFYPVLHWFDTMVRVDASGGARTFELPEVAFVGANWKITILKADASANAVTVSGADGTINGAATYVLASQYKRATFQTDGTNWFVVENN